MINFSFVVGLGILLTVAFAWGFRVLPEERWQILAALPQHKESADRWCGVNLTFYGVFLATACTLAVGLLLVLLASIGMPLFTALILIAASLALCLPSAKLIAWLVERQRHTFTVAGAFFVGCLTIPVVVLALNSCFHAEIPMFPTLAAVAVSYALGESVGRLACVSFGCCYGKPLEQCPPLVRWLFAPMACVFHGPTKKAAYESRLEGVRLVPIQAVTAVWFAVCCMLGLGLFLAASFRSAALVTVIATQSWRWMSEFLRADYRGQGKWSVYQGMALLAIGYTAAVAIFAGPAPSIAVDLGRAPEWLWNPATIVFLQALWLVVFLYTGRSQMTASQISFNVVRNANRDCP